MELMQDYWYIILEAKDLKLGKPTQLKRFGKNLTLWRDEKGEVNCLEDRCPHRGASLGLGKVENGCVVCPFHGAAFDGSGNCSHLPFVDEESVKEKLKIESFRVSEKYGFVWLWYGDNFNGQEPCLFNDLDKGFAFHTMNKSWNTHYSRVIENQLDYYHLPFVHKQTIGRGFKPPVASELPEKMRVTFENDVISAFLEIPSRSGSSQFRFMFPNAWQLRISPFMFLFAAFCPVDDENTVMILRTYFRGKSFVALKTWMLKMSPIFNYKILAEDEAVVLSQRPKKISEHMEDNLIAYDKPIAFFRKHYFSRIKPAKTAQLRSIKTVAR